MHTHGTPPILDFVASLRSNAPTAGGKRLTAIDRLQDFLSHPTLAPLLKPDGTTFERGALRLNIVNPANGLVTERLWIGPKSSEHIVTIEVQKDLKALLDSRKSQLLGLNFGSAISIGETHRSKILVHVGVLPPAAKLTGLAELIANAVLSSAAP